MNIKLEELRKRLLQPGSVVPAPSATLKSRRQVSPAFPVLLPRSANEDSSDSRQGNVLTGEELPRARSKMALIEATRPDKDDQAAAAAAPIDPKAPAAVTLQADGHTNVTADNQLIEAIEKLFEPARQCQGRLREISQTCEAIDQLTRSTLELCHPLRNFGDHLRKLSNAFFSMRTVRDELAILAESFEPIAIFKSQLVQLDGAVQAQLADVAKTLESTKILTTRIVELEHSVASISELEAQFLELSRCFGDASDINRENTEAGGDTRSTISQ